MIHVKHTCDVCGVEKVETPAETWFGLQRKSRSTIYPTLEILSFRDVGADGPHICGSTCLAVEVAEFTEELIREIANRREDE